MPDPPVPVALAPYPETSFFFTVKVGSELYSFKEVSGIGSEMQVDEIPEGGENTFIHRLPKGMKQANLTLKGCLLPKDSDLLGWCGKILQQCRYPFETRPIEVQLLKADATPARSWKFENAYPIKWEIDKLDAQENKIAVETLVFCYSHMTRD